MTATTHWLRASLAHLPGMGPSAEVKAWRLGVVSWGDLRREARNLFSTSTAHRVISGIAESEAALARRDAQFFLRCLPRGDRIRAHPLLQDRLLYLDLETTGLDPHRDRITTVVTYDRQHLRAFIRHENLHQLAPHLQQAQCLVTFNGHRFDMRFLRRDLGLRLPHMHLDLCPILRSRHLCGGLKQLERRLGVARPAHEHGEGDQAPALWSRWRAGDATSLHRLLVYNAHDTLALERLLIAAFNLSMGACPAFACLPTPRQPHPEGARLLHECSLTS